MSTEPLKPWKHLDSKSGPSLIIFKSRYDQVENPRTGETFSRLVLETPSWVNVLALTEDQQIVLVRQYRFGTRSFTLEIPGGVVERGEDPVRAAERELLEETGYTAQSFRSLGAVEPNPAFHDNLCFHVLATGARRVKDQSLDDGEDIEVLLRPLVSLRDAVLSGEIRHALVISALSRLVDLR